MAAPRDAYDRGPVLCEYFFTCERVADGITLHQMAGEVPICEPCARLVNVERHLYLPAQTTTRGRGHDQTPVQHGHSLAHQRPPLTGPDAAPTGAERAGAGSR